MSTVPTPEIERDKKPNALEMRGMLRGIELHIAHIQTVARMNWETQLEQELEVLGFESKQTRIRFAARHNL